MRKERHINTLGTTLLLLYIFSLTFSLVFHHHHSDKIVAFSEADSCEKAIYYGIQDHHKQHINKAQDKCWLCDHHTITPQILLNNDFIFIQTGFFTEYATCYKHFYDIDLTEKSNKDPPYLYKFFG